MLRIAIQSKGRLNEESLTLLQDIGIEVDVPKRKLVSRSQTFPIEALYLRDDDIPRVVAAGVVAGVVAGVMAGVIIRADTASRSRAGGGGRGSLFPRFHSRGIF